MIGAYIKILILPEKDAILGYGNTCKLQINKKRFILFKDNLLKTFIFK